MWRFIKRNYLNSNLGLTLCSLIIILSFGSFAWHASRSELTLWFDTIPIYIFIIYIAFLLIQSLTRNIKYTSGFVALISLIYFLVFTYIPNINILSGLSKYIFAFCVFIIITIFVSIKYGMKHDFIYPLSIFGLAIVFRGIDLLVCSNFPLGTHFLWHITVAAAMYSSSLVVLTLNTKVNKLQA
ncbi:MAG: hypothetical protein G01um101424_63 [Parcubacteria group bacterium Gr01-1014_24]|nr:MAG: hypothetical protein G01um101424_63 [Parcubacteria group bacterium Gr01-1014_24]